MEASGLFFGVSFLGIYHNIYLVLSITIIFPTHLLSSVNWCFQKTISHPCMSQLFLNWPFRKAAIKFSAVVCKKTYDKYSVVSLGSATKPHIVYALFTSLLVTESGAVVDFS